MSTKYLARQRMDKLIEIISLKDRSGKAEEGLEVRVLLRAYHHHYEGKELESDEMVTAGGASGPPGVTGK